ncbi:hypothetical protein [Marinirhabdus gelatinilytica]|uniref:Sugar transporter n=1 Tax=Marinirhabdus gelatinilytica TaxID=1703343 RepID=A0A370QA70_9FLAO|nr:hypothetical protein [Marinirhabdus gelatinilytica]RDK85268.1 hypothetical protein C8D94_10386 [Marinirhabdus gelatinilytica]
MNTTIKPPKSFWIIAVIALLWNLMGVYQYYLGTYELESLRESVPADQFVIMESLPAWYSIVFAIAVFSGLLGCILLLARKKLAVLLFALSLLTVLVIEIYWLMATDILQVAGYGAAVMPLLVIAVAIFLYFYSKGAARNAWLG